MTSSCHSESHKRTHHVVKTQARFLVSYGFIHSSSALHLIFFCPGPFTIHPSFSRNSLKDRELYINHKVRKDRITLSYSSLFILTNPSIPHMAERQVSHIKLKALNFFPLGPVLSTGAQWICQFPWADSLLSHRCHWRPTQGATSADGVDAWGYFPTEARKQQGKAKPASLGWD